MAKTKLETPNLPFYFKRLGAFMENVKVSAVQQKDLDMARNALMEIIEIIYGAGEVRACVGQRPLFPPIS